MARILVMHEAHGCQTGCCGHIVYVDNESYTDHRFNHPGGTPPKSWAEQIVQEMGCDLGDLDWEHSIVISGDECPNWHIPE